MTNEGNLLPEGAIRIVSRDPSDVEVAAVTAVITAALEDQSNGQSATTAGISGWQRSQRALRTPLHPGPGAWRQS